MLTVAEQRKRETPASNHLGANFDTTQLLCQSGTGSRGLVGKALLELAGKLGKLDFDTLLLGVAFGETHLLDADLAGLQLLLAEDDGEGDTALFRGLELLGELGLHLVGEFSLEIISLFHM